MALAMMALTVMTGACIRFSTESLMLHDHAPDAVRTAATGGVFAFVTLSDFNDYVKAATLVVVLVYWTVKLVQRLKGRKGS